MATSIPLNTVNANLSDGRQYWITAPQESTNDPSKLVYAIVTPEGDRPGLSIIAEFEQDWDAIIAISVLMRASFIAAV